MALNNPLLRPLLRRNLAVDILRAWAAGAGAASPQPADFADVSVLMNFEDGTDAGQDSADLSFSPNAITWQAADLATTQAKFGTLSLDLGSKAQIKYVNVADDANLEFGTGDFTMEAEVYLTELPSEGGSNPMMLFSKYASTGTIRSYQFMLSAADEIEFRYSTDSTGNTTVATTAAALVKDEWMHIAVTRESNVVRIFQGGNLLAESDEGSKDYFDGANALTVGGQAWASFEYSVGGFMDEVRVVKGEAIYTEAFDPPTESHPRSANAGIEIEHFTAEGFVHEDFAGDGTWQDSANVVIPAASLSAGDWLFFVDAFCANSSSSSNNQRIRLVEQDGTPTQVGKQTKSEYSTTLSGNNRGESNPIMARYTVDGSFDIGLQVNSAVSTTHQVSFWRIFAIKLSDLTEGADFWYDEDLTGATDLLLNTWVPTGATVTPSAGVPVLVMSDLRFTQGSSREVSIALVENSVRFEVGGNEGEDNGEEKGMSGIMTIAAANGTAITVEARVDGSSTGDIMDSRVFVLNLNAFKDRAVQFDATEFDYTTGYTEVDRMNFVAGFTGDYCIFGAYHLVNGGAALGIGAIETDIDAAGEILLGGDDANAHTMNSSGSPNSSVSLWGNLTLAAAESVDVVLYYEGASAVIESDNLSFAAFSWTIA